MNTSVEAFLTQVYVLVDDWCQEPGAALLGGRVGAKPVVSDSEVLTLILAQHALGFPTERRWLRYVHHNLRALFPQQLSQSEFNRRARNLWGALEELRKWVLVQMEVRPETYRLLDSTPVHVRHWRRHGPGHLRLEGAALGYCAAKRETFYGYRLLVLTTLDGVITDWTLIPANADEREGADDMLEEYVNLRVLGDKGFIDGFWQAELQQRQGIVVHTPKRVNQKEQNPPEWDALLNRARRLVETSFAQAKAFLGLERPGARTLWGLGSRLRAKLAALTLLAWVNRQAGRSPLTIAGFAC